MVAVNVLMEVSRRYGWSGFCNSSVKKYPLLNAAITIKLNVDFALLADIRFFENSANTLVRLPNSVRHYTCIAHGVPALARCITHTTHPSNLLRVERRRRIVLAFVS